MKGHGAFSEEEHKLFMERILEVGVNIQWGIFSQKIPTRVGYQCSNYYRDLLKKKWITDPNYLTVVDAKTGKEKLCFKRGVNNYKKKYDEQHLERCFSFTVHNDPSGVFSDLPANHKLCPVKYKWNSDIQKGRETINDSEVSPVLQSQSKKTRKRKRDEDINDDQEEECFLSDKKKRRVERSDKENENPLPGFIDFITGKEIVNPAISKYGHVLGYDTWCKILRKEGSKDTCPFTKQRVTRRSLVKLSHGNIDKYRKQIINMTEGGTVPMS